MTEVMSDQNRAPEPETSDKVLEKEAGRTDVGSVDYVSFPYKLGGVVDTKPEDYEF